MKQLAKALAKKASQRDYTNGHPEEKVWINFQVTKGLKRQFRDHCKEYKINASEYIRECIETLISEKIDINVVDKDS